ncbi:hypothetical protein G9C98_007067 [Cotesia typhae]|uniref:Peptidase M12B domain-containing protein n=1 Tax=Cotesia typhae TaxID=2053667 RepID=A0A8J5VCB5_9HYME|nr:hypothetical protein G9C98_007067 [Cotesia typhae]
MIRKISLIIFAVISSSCSQSFHHHLTDEELQSIFQSSRDRVPYYEVVPVSHTFHARAMHEDQTVKINSFGQNLEMYLNPSDGYLVSENTPVWMAQRNVNSLNGVKYRKVKNPFRDVGRAYQDAQTNSAVVIYRSNRNKIKLFGKIHKDFIIRPLPERFLNRFFRVKRSVGNETEKSEFAETHHHIIYKRPEMSSTELKNAIRVVERTRKSHHNRNKRSLPDVIYPQVLVILDSSLYHYDMCNVEYGYCDTSTLGYAFEMGACNRSSIDRNTEAVGIVEDDAGFSAILPTAHEVGHLVGVPHDGTEEASDCSGFDGYIMTSTVTFGENSFHWSKCSKRLMAEFFAMSDASCLFDQPRRSKLIPHMLPGKIQSLDQQCQKVYGTKACFYDERVCMKLECQIPRGGGSCKSMSSAAEGSKCGEGMFCIRGNCIAENSTTVPNWEETKPKINPFRNNFHFGLSPIKIN